MIHFQTDSFPIRFLDLQPNIVPVPFSFLFWNRSLPNRLETQTHQGHSPGQVLDFTSKKIKPTIQINATMNHHFKNIENSIFNPNSKPRKQNPTKCRLITPKNPKRSSNNKFSSNKNANKTQKPKSRSTNPIKFKPNSNHKISKSEIEKSNNLQVGPENQELYLQLVWKSQLRSRRLMRRITEADPSLPILYCFILNFLFLSVSFWYSQPDICWSWLNLTALSMLEIYFSDLNVHTSSGFIWTTNYLDQNILFKFLKWFYFSQQK